MSQRLKSSFPLWVGGVALCACTGFGVVGCGVTDAISSAVGKVKHSVTNLPSKFSLSMPSSLRKPAAAAAKVATDQVDDEADSLAYDELQDLAEQLLGRVRETQYTFMLLDTFLGDDAVTAPTTDGGTAFFDAGAVTLTFTEEMFNTLDELYEEDGLEIEDFDDDVSTDGTDDDSDDDLIPTIGDTLESPPVCLTKLAAGGAYDWEVKVEFDNPSGITDCDSTFQDTYRWNTAFTKIFISESFSETEGSDTYSGSASFAFDSVDNVMSFKDQFRAGAVEFSESAKFESCGESTDCVKVEAKYSERGTSETALFTITGKADTNGGAIEAVARIEGGANAGNFCYQEVFSGAGVLEGSRFVDQCNDVDSATFGNWDGTDSSADAYLEDISDTSFEIEDDFTVTISGSFLPDTNSDEEVEFVITVANGDPTDPEDVIGEGFAYYDDALVLEIWFWGEEDPTDPEVHTFGGFNQSGDPTFTEVGSSDVTITVEAATP